MSRVLANGASLHYEEAGRGSPVVLVHGGLSDFEEWGPVLAHLSADHRVIAYSRRNAHPNEVHARTPWGIREHAEDLAAVIVELGATPAHLVGESYGAFVALECAMRHPEIVRSLAIDEPPIPSLLSTPADAALRGELDTVLAEARASLEARDPERAVRRVIDHVEGSHDAYSSLPLAVRTTILRNAEAFRLELEAGLPTVSPTELRQLGLPTLLMTSTIGPRALARVTALVAEAIPGSRLVPVAGTTHGSLIFSPEYARIVEGFLGARS